MPDLDDVLAYTTERKVVIRHRWVGGLYYATIALIAAYIIGVELVINQGYYAVQPLAGSIRATVHSPQVYSPLDTLPYCDNAYNITCVSWDQSLVSHIQPDVGLLVATRIKRMVEVANDACDEYSYGCSPWLRDPAGTRVVFLGDVENATVLVQHAASHAGATSGYNKTVVNSFQSQRPTPWLHGAAKSLPVTKMCSCGAEEEARPAPPAGCDSVPGCSDVGDLFRVGELLATIGISLSDGASPDAGAAPDESLRYAGLTVRLAVRYDSKTSYSYLASANEIEAKLQSVDRLNATRRMVDDMHGVQILFAQGTGYDQFDPRTLLLTLVSGLALLSVAKTVADSFLLYLAPRRKDYALFVNSTTPDFSPDSERERKLLDRLLAKKRRKLLLLTETDELHEGLHPLHAEPVGTPAGSGPRPPVAPVRHPQTANGYLA